MGLATAGDTSSKQIGTADWHSANPSGCFCSRGPAAIWPDTFPTNRLPDDPLRLLPDPRPAGSMCVGGPDAGSFPRPARSRSPPWSRRSSPSGPSNSTCSDCARASCSSADAASASGGRSGGSRSARSALRGTISVSVIAWSLSESDDSESGRVTDTADLTRAPLTAMAARSGACGMRLGYEVEGAAFSPHCWVL